MKPGMKTKIITGVILLAITIPPVLFGGFLLRILIGLLTLSATYEISALDNQKGDWLLTIVFTLVIMLFTFVPSRLYPVALASLILFLFGMVFVNPRYSVDHAAYSILILVIISLAWQGAFYTYQIGWGFRGAVYILLATFLCDTGAYFFGVFFGKHKMVPNISPNKTWEGAIGGYFVALLASLIYGLIYCTDLPKSFIVTGSILLPIVAQIGDLAFSSIKRRFAIKDFGSFLPGHGGILDRIDSLLFCLMILNAMYLIWGI